MKILRADVKGPITIHVVESEEDLLGFRDFVLANPHMGFDTETTGLDWWNPGNGFHCRLAQFGNWDTAWVLPVERGEVFKKATKWALETAKRLSAQNRGFDIHTVEEDLGVDPFPLVQKTWDTKILAHLVDGRAVKEGGVGLKLEELVPHYIDADTGAKVKKSMTEIAQDMNRQKKVAGYSYKDKDKQLHRVLLEDEPSITPEDLKARGFSYVREFKEPIHGKVNKDNVWKKVPLDHEGYLLYAGMDPIFAFRLTKILFPLIPRRSLHYGLIGWEHRLNWVTYQMERTGYLVDEKYTRGRIKELEAEEVRLLEIIQGYGVESPGSNEQLVEALQGFGVKLKEKTAPTERHPEGQYRMDEAILSSIEHPLAQAVLDYKSASKKRSNWFEKALNYRDKNGRVHVSINSLHARTSRMSITGAIPAQTLPAGTGYVRHCFLAEEGHVTATVDYKSMELMFLAAESGDRRMLKAYNEAEDLHDITALGAFGPMGWSPEDGGHHPKRKAGKGTNYTVCFGGGWNAVSTQWDIAEDDAKAAVKAFWETYPATKVLSNKFSDEARKNGFIYTATGRRILTDEKRPYAGMNYRIQGTCRDITARALIELDKAGFTPYMRLPVHDEIVFSFPKQRAEELTKQAAQIMQFKYKGLLIPADGEIGEQSWGSVIDQEGSKH
ncbi:DNA polymerase [Streptomyces sp. NPDC006261]|uniref:DNA polymerase n=1 Tax=Streptomyces sp. NPDC006261 TaxID=3156739 RepID=UPI0033B71154